MLVTVVVAVFNGKPLLDRCLRSVLEQREADCELVVMDGGSTDGTTEVLAAYASALAHWESRPDNGLYAAWNRALDYASGEWVMFLGADDYLWSDIALRDIRPHLLCANRRGVRLVYGRAASVNAHNEVRKYLGEPWDTQKSLRSHQMPPHPGLLHKREMFAELGRFDEAYRIAGDYEFLIRELRTRDALFAPSVVVAGVQYGGMSCTPKHLMRLIIEDMRARRKHGCETINLPIAKYYLALIRESLGYGRA